jgi:catechol 2,3-dioxygenase-like lactoylglutathione lyase family enzyme
MRTNSTAWIVAAGVFLLGPITALQSKQPSGGPGLFEGQTDVGSVMPAGTGGFNPATGVYTLTAAGANTWYHVDNFHYSWKKAAGDLVLTADISFPPHTYDHEPDPHRKGILMFRQTLDPGGVYIGLAAHGSGLVALQFRRERGANSADVEVNIEAPKTLRIEKRGDIFTAYVSMKGEPLHPVGATVALHLEEPFYVGLGAVSHDVNTTDTVVFAHVALQAPAPVATGSRTSLYSTLQTISINDQFRRSMVVRSVPEYMQSPNWAPGGKDIYVHERGRIERIPYLEPPAGGEPQVIDTGQLVGCSGNFGLSPDGKLLAVSCSEVKGGPHEVYVLPAAGGGMPRKVTSSSTSSYFHAWSPDSRTIGFTRGSASKADLFAIPVDGGAEVRLTSDTVNDGPDYSPDGKYIYFDSARSGTVQIWRMRPDGSAAEQITDDDNINSSPHVAPDGKSVAFLSQPARDTRDIGDAALKVISSSDGLIRTVANFRGNRGSFSMYGWGDATHLAYVSYQTLSAATQMEARGASTAADARPAITGVSHIAVYATDSERTDRFYVHDLGGTKGVDGEDGKGVRYYFAPTQFVEVLPLPEGSASINRLDHVAFVTANAEALRRYLASRKVTVPAKAQRGADGGAWFTVIDPEGNKIQFVQPPADAPEVPVNPLSNHIIHVGFIIHNRALEDGFFRTILGFRPYWFGGMKDDTPNWISQQVPDGTDWLEYMLVGTPDGRGIPATMSHADLGVLNHFSLGVPSTESAYTLLWNGDRLTGQSNTPKIGRDAKWQLNLFDPDGTRAEIMEFHAVGTPCCSAFTASDPQK